jgi:peptidoglycan/LPS O-acetylase OafA/YrhL
MAAPLCPTDTTVRKGATTPIARTLKLRPILSHTGMRGIAALMVIAYHLQYVAGHLALEDATTFFRRSYLMVDLFFVLSGFIIAYKYEENRTAFMGMREIRTFLIKRFDRIYPLHITILILMLSYNIVLTVVYSILAKNIPVDWSHHNNTILITQVLLLNAWVPNPNGWNIPSWSISAEFVAYLAFPAMVWVTVKRPRLASAVMAGAALLFYVFVSKGGSLDITGGVGAPARCLAGFFAGFIIHACRDWFDRRSTTDLTVLQIGATIWIAITMLNPIADRYAIPAFIALVGATWPDRGIIAKALSTKTMAWFGERSYAVYISHIFVIGLVSFVWVRTGERLISNPAGSRALFLILCFASALFAANWLHRYVEVWARKNMNRWLARTT